MPTFQVVDLHGIPATAPDTYAPIYTAQGHVSPIATGVAGLIGGALVGAGFAVSRKLSSDKAPEAGEVTGGKE
jgi:hypothetical protein